MKRAVFFWFLVFATSAGGIAVAPFKFATESACLNAGVHVTKQIPDSWAVCVDSNAQSFN